jgi:methyltransferase (TIGR00027 family)
VVNQVTQHAPEMNGVARTARWTAAARARETARPDRLFADPLAGLLAGPDGHELLRHFHTSRASDEGNPFLPIRTRWFDEFLATATAGTGCQVVGLGAGLDTRAFRLDWPEWTVLFEVDQPALLAYKDTVLSDARPPSRCDRRMVPIDLADDWPSALLAAGFDRDRPTVWFAEGLLFYLPEELAGTTVRRAGALSVPGSRFAADLIGTGIFRFPYMQPFLRKLADAGSPWQFGTDEPRRFVRECGWTVTSVAEPGAPTASFGRWPAGANPGGLADLPRSYLLTARMPAHEEA